MSRVNLNMALLRSFTLLNELGNYKYLAPNGAKTRA